MARERFCKVCTGWHRLDKPWPHNCREPAKARSNHPAPMLIADTMDPVKSMLDGKMYDSKHRLRDTYRQAGMLELGNDSPTEWQKPPKDETYEKGVIDSIDKALCRVGVTP